MSSYQGSDREELRRAGVSEASLTSAEEPRHEPVNASFTPINRQASGSNNPRGRSIDSDALYDLPEDSPPESSIPKKRGRKPALMPRSITLGQVWEYEDEGDSPQQGDLPAPKKRRAAPLKRAKPIKSVLKGLTATQQPNEHTAQQDTEGNDESGGSQLTTPPETGKKTKRKASAGASRGGGKPTQIFANSSITKPSSNKKRGFKDLSQSQANSNHKGWTTTEDAFKSSPIVPARTTLDKLASFRYNASSTQQPPIILKPDFSTISSGHNSVSQQCSVSPHVSIHTSSDYGFPPSDDSYFNQALWNIKGDLSNKNFAEENGMMVEISRDHDVHNETNREPTQDFDDRIHTGVNPNSYSAGQNASPRHFDAQPQHTIPEEPQTQHPSESEPLLEEHALEDYALKERVPEGGSSPLSDNLISSPSADAECLRQSEAKGHSTHDPYVQDSPSDPSCVPSTHFPTRKEPAEDLCSSDDFDEQGIEDDDLLALVSGKTAEIPTTGQQMQETRALGTCHVHSTHKPFPNLPDESFPSASEQQPCLSSPDMLIDDDFPDSDVEEVMLNLPELKNGVRETFEPPASVTQQCVFDDDSVNEEVYDGTLKFSPPGTHTQEKNTAQDVREKLNEISITSTLSPFSSTLGSIPKYTFMTPDEYEFLTDCSACTKAEELMDAPEAEDWDFIRLDNADEDRNDPFKETRPAFSQAATPPTVHTGPGIQSSPESVVMMTSVSHPRTSITLDDSYDYLPLQAFARPDFPSLVRDRSPVLGLSTQTVLRTCFRIGEMLKQGARCNAVGQDALIELFARVTFSSREPGARQHFQFADLFHDRPPFPNGILENFKTSGLAESESKVFIGSEISDASMARIVGRLRKDVKNACWFLSVSNIRKTDWEEIKWTKRIVSAQKVKV